MLSESDLIPYHCSPLPEGPWLLFAPHADDETFGLGGTLALASAAGIGVTVVILTDGALGGRGDAQALCATRKEEARRALALLGVEEPPLFWDEPDRGVRAEDRLIGRVATLIDQRVPAHVFFPSPMEPHVDHRAAAATVWEGVRWASNEAVVPVAYGITVQGPVNRLFDISSVIERKRAAIDAYVSQLNENNYYQIAHALDVARTFSLGAESRAAEGVYLFPRTELRRGYAEMVQRLLSPYWLGEPPAEVVREAAPTPLRRLLRRLARGGS